MDRNHIGDGVKGILPVKFGLQDLIFHSFAAGDAIFLIEAEGEKLGDIVDANLAAAEMHGYTIDELLGLNLIKDLDAPD
ncbi:unnamed protein product, partial [marine sediment metagenome]